MKKVLGFYIFLFALLPIAIFIAYPQEISEKNLAPNFTLPSSNGNDVTLTQFRGKYVVLEWVNYDCPFVRKHYNSMNMQKLQSEYVAKGVIWLSICSSAPGKQGYFTKDEINKRMQTLGANPTAYLIDEKGTVGQLYSARTTPQIVIINPMGRLIYNGAIDNKPSTDTTDIRTSINFVSESLDSAMNDRPLIRSVTVPYGCSVKYAR